MTQKFDWKPGKEYKEIVYETMDGIAKITINRPQVRNAFTPLTVQEMFDAFSTAGTWDRIISLV